MLLAVLLGLTASLTALGQAADKKPNIVFIMGDDIGIMQPGIYHRGLMVGETPNIDRIGAEGALFQTYYAEESCTAGRNAFFTGMHPLRTEASDRGAGYVAMTERAARKGRPLRLSIRDGLADHSLWWPAFFISRRIPSRL